MARRIIPGSGAEVMEGSQRQRPTSGKGGPETQQVQQKPGGPDTPEVYSPRPTQPYAPNVPATDLFKTAEDEYKAFKYGYDPYEQDRAGIFEAQNFDPYRDAAMAQADQGASEQRQGAYNQLLQSGPISASDRMALASDFNRRKITGSTAAGMGADQRSIQSMMQTGQQNIGRGMDVNQANTMAQNQMLRGKASAEENRRLNLYKSKKEEELLEKKLKAAADIARTPGVEKNFVEKLMDYTPIGIASKYF